MTLDQFLNQPGIKASEFAAKVGLAEPSISRIRKGAQNISRDIIRRIVAATDGLVTADELVFDHADPATTAEDVASSGKSADATAQVAA